SSRAAGGSSRSRESALIRPQLLLLVFRCFRRLTWRTRRTVFDMTGETRDLSQSIRVLVLELGQRLSPLLNTALLAKYRHQRRHRIGGADMVRPESQEPLKACEGGGSFFRGVALAPLEREAVREMRRIGRIRERFGQILEIAETCRPVGCGSTVFARS